jgi:MFS family permease
MRPWMIAACGCAALAMAMGVGRFAFTPILPMMQDQFGTSVAEGGWLAAAHYGAYLLGALCAFRVAVSQRFAIRAGLVAIAIGTLGMALTGNLAAWLVLRALPGFASAWVLVCVSTWALDRLATAGRPDLAGIVYSGVGAGIVFAGATCVALSQALRASSDAWLVLGLVSAALTALLWPVAGSGDTALAAAPAIRSAPREIPNFWRLVLCYGASGIGYVIPATFLPVMAKSIISDPLWFGWAWPAFGAAAIASTLLAARLTNTFSYRSVWAAGTLVMGIGVLAPLAIPGLAGIVVAALCVGGTFMVTTMAGFQEARRVTQAHARALIGAMTAAFSVGQILGPLLVAGLVELGGGFRAALIAAASPLFIAAGMLYAARAPAPIPSASR